MGTPKGILFDLDDTILAFDIAAYPSWEKVCRQHENELALVSADKLLAGIREYSKWFWSEPERHRENRLNLPLARRRIVTGAMKNLQMYNEALANTIADAYSDERVRRIEPFPGAVETIRQLREREIKLGLITNGAADSQRAKIVRFGLETLFDVIVIEGEFGVGKPDEQVYRYALTQLGLSPDEVWMVGDHLVWDVAGPKKLGIRGIWIDHAGQGVPNDVDVRPDLILHAVSELLHDFERTSHKNQTLT